MFILVDLLFLPFECLQYAEVTFENYVDEFLLTSLRKYLLVHPITHSDECVQNLFEHQRGLVLENWQLKEELQFPVLLPQLKFGEHLGVILLVESSKVALV